MSSLWVLLADVSLQQTAKVGLAVSLELASEELMEQQETADAANITPPPF